MFIWESELRLYVAPLLAVTGVVIAMRGVDRSHHAVRLPPGDASKAFALMSGFRLAIVGPAMALVALGWVLQSVALVATAAIIGAGEMFETSLDVWALKQRPWTYGTASRPRSAGSSRIAPKV